MEFNNVWRIKAMYKNGRLLYAPYYRCRFIFWHIWCPVYLSEYLEIPCYIDYETFDTFICQNCLAFFSEENALKFIKMYEDHQELIDKTRKIPPKFIYPSENKEETDGKRTDKD